MKVLVLRSEEGKITSKEELTGELKDVVLQVANKALQEWNLDSSDFTIMKDSLEVTIPLPLTKEQLATLKNYLKGRGTKEAIAELPVYIISFENQWSESEYLDKKVYVIAPSVDSNVAKEIEDYAAELTNPQKGEELEEEEEEE